RTMLELGRRAGSARAALADLDASVSEDTSLGGIAFLAGLPEDRVDHLNDRLNTGIRWQPFAGAYSALMLSAEDLHTLEDLFEGYGDHSEPEEASGNQTEPEPAIGSEEPAQEPEAPEEETGGTAAEPDGEASGMAAEAGEEGAEGPGADAGRAA
ncbi:MAG: hypothetical protein ABEJ96_07435, partial [Thiohalorhabdaceae bacterium]